jgi:hypothetical protein
LVTLMVKGNETIIKMRVFQLDSKTLLKSTLYHQCGKNYYIHLHVPIFLHWSIKQFLTIYEF